MDKTKTLNRNFEMMTWGALFIWWGIAEFKLVPAGAGLIGIGLILLGLNAARLANGIPTSGFTIALGITAVVLGGLALARTLLGLPFEIPSFAIFLIVIGVVMLARALLRGNNEQRGLNHVP